MLEGLDILGSEHGLRPLEPVQVSMRRSKTSRGEKAADMLHGLPVRTLRSAGDDIVWEATVTFGKCSR